MKTAMSACMALCLVACAWAQPSSDASSASESASRGSVPGGIPITQLIATVSRSSGKKFIIDPRVRGDVSLVGINPSSVSYAELLTILHLHGFVAGEQGGIVLVVPDASARTMPSPLLTEKETRPDAEIVTDTMQVKNAPAGLLVPLLRPMLPQYAHLAADVCNNTLIIVDTFANVKRIEAIVRRLDVGESFKSHPCEASAAPSAPRELPPREPPLPGR